MSTANNAVSSADLLNRIKNSTLEPDELKQAAVMASKLSKYGLKDWCIRGMPGPNGVCSTFHIEPASLGDFFVELDALKGPVFNADIFPLGIKAPELYEVHIKFGDRVRGI